MSETIQELLARARREQILRAAAKVFAEKGFHATTIKDIAKEAGIADGTIYNYFKDKPALLFAIFERMRQNIVAEVDPAALTSLSLHDFLKVHLQHPLAALRNEEFALFRVTVSEMLVNQELRTLYKQEILERMLAPVEAFMQDYAQQHATDPAWAKFTVRILLSLVIGLSLQASLDDEELKSRWDELPALVADLLIHGLESAER